MISKHDSLMRLHLKIMGGYVSLIVVFVIASIVIYREH